MAIESRLDAFKAQNTASFSPKAADSSSKGKSSTATPGVLGKRLSVGDYVFVMRDNKAVKGQIIGIGKHKKGKDAPLVKWNSGSESVAKYSALKLDNYCHDHSHDQKI